MPSLYVCVFSNGHIKVGRSIDASARIALHADRVSCMGVTLAESYITECPANDEGRELALINRCALAAKERFQSEWFAGLDFREVCAWAADAARAEAPEPFELNRERPDFRAIVRRLQEAGYGQVLLAQKCGISQPSISDIARGLTKEPSYSVGFALVRLAEELLTLAA